MALPHQVPLYQALDAVDNQDFDTAEQSVTRFFEALENDAIAKDCRRQHFDRQVFEADFLSVLTKEEIDAWGVLATVKFSRDDMEGARSDCFRMIELIDQYYGFETPSWNSPEARIPINPELMSRYFQIASLLTLIYERLDDMEMSQRWSNVRKTAVSDIQQPEEVWGRWISEDEAAMSVGITIYEFSDWQIEKREADGREWLANIYRSLPERISPLEMKWLVTVHIPTDTAADVPSKAIRWKIWSLRLAIASRLHRAKVGAYFGELQSRGERVLLYYASSEDAVKEAMGRILEDASELNPQLEIKYDEGWQEYSKWGDSSIITAPLNAVPMPEPSDDEHENDQILRKIWSSCETILDTSGRLYSLLYDCKNFAPKNDALRRYCVDYLFELAHRLCGENKTRAMLQLVQYLPKFDATSALRAFDEMWQEPYPSEEMDLAFAAESLAAVAPLKALLIVEYLKKRGFSYIHKAQGEIIKVLGASDVSKAMQLAQDARSYTAEHSENEFAKANAYIYLARIIHNFSPEFARELLIEAEAFCQAHRDASVRDQIYSDILRCCNLIAHDKFDEFCHRAIENSIKLEEDDPNDFWGFGGPRRAILSQSMLIKHVVKCDHNEALKLLKRALTSLTAYTDNGFDRVTSLTHIAESASCIDQEVNKELCEEIWSILTQSMDEVSSPDSYFLNRRLESGSRNPFNSFIKMNPKVAEARFSSILKICTSAGLPEREVILLCTFATLMNTDFPKRARELVSLAESKTEECSSDHLRVLSRMHVIAAKEKLGLCDDEKFLQVRNTIKEVFTETGQFHLFLECAILFGDSASGKRTQLLHDAFNLLEAYDIEQRDALEVIKALPVSETTKLFFLLVEKNDNEARRREALSWFSNQFEENESSDDDTQEV